MVVLSVVTDGVDATAAKTIMKEAGVSPSYPVLMDPDFTATDAYTNFMVPHTLVIDRKGIIRRSYRPEAGAPPAGGGVPAGSLRRK